MAIWRQVGRGLRGKPLLALVLVLALVLALALVLLLESCGCPLSVPYLPLHLGGRVGRVELLPAGRVPPLPAA